MPLIATALIFTGSNPASFAARIPSITCSNPGRRVSCWNRSGSIVSRLTLIRRSPASQSGFASGARRIPLVVRPMSLIPGIAAILATSRGRSRRTSGSPPVSRILSIPSGTTIRTNRSISSKLRSRLRARNCGFSGMQ